MSSVYEGRAVLGRQPETVYITPSKPNAWYGTIVEGRELTAQQHHALVHVHGLSASHETMEVVRQATDREMWWPNGTLAPVYIFRCPVLRRRADGKVDVIAPDGTTKRVRANGWTSKPGGLRRSFS